MKASELRIGNYVKNAAWNGEECKIDSGDLLAMSLCEVAGYEAEFIAPIPLTEEWLIKFGFEYEKSTVGGYERWEITTVKGRRIKLLDKKFSWGPGEYSDYILYVHQLQNLYFALT